MVKTLAGIFIIMCIYLVPRFADGQAPVGIYGIVYDHNDDPAGQDKDTIYVIHQSDCDAVGHDYDWFDSSWITNGTYGLYNGWWWIQGKTIEGGTPYYSHLYDVYWRDPWSVRRDIYCNSTGRAMPECSK